MGCVEWMVAICGDRTIASARWKRLGPEARWWRRRRDGPAKHRFVFDIGFPNAVGQLLVDERADLLVARAPSAEGEKQECRQPRRPPPPPSRGHHVVQANKRRGSDLSSRSGFLRFFVCRCFLYLYLKILQVAVISMNLLDSLLENLFVVDELFRATRESEGHHGPALNSLKYMSS